MLLVFCIAVWKSAGLTASGLAVPQPRRPRLSLRIHTSTATEKALPEPEGGYLAACLAVKDQPGDLREWIEHHQACLVLIVFTLIYPSCLSPHAAFTGWLQMKPSKAAKPVSIHMQPISSYLLHLLPACEADACVQALGVSKFYIFDNNSTVPLLDEVWDYVQSGLVQYQYIVEFDHPTGAILLYQHRYFVREKDIALLQASRSCISMTPAYGSTGMSTAGWHLLTQMSSSSSATTPPACPRCCMTTRHMEDWPSTGRSYSYNLLFLERNSPSALLNQEA